MSKKDLGKLSNVYGDMLNGLKKDLIKEGKVGPGKVGEADLKDGGPTEEGGFQEAEVDIEKAGEEENAYNIKGLSYGNGNNPGNTEGPEPTENGAVTGIVGKQKKKKGAKEEDEEEESSSEVEKIAQESLNNFMKRKSVFDNLYNKVMVNENYEMEETDLDALGLDDATPDDELDEGGDEGEVTISLSKDLAQQLHDVLMSVLTDEDADEDLGMEDAEMCDEEDEEGTPTAMNTHYDDGKHNKVGTVKPAAKKADASVSGKVDPGSAMNTKYDDGKHNKVGDLKAGQGAFE